MKRIALFLFILILGNSMHGASARGLDLYCSKFRQIIGDELKRPEVPSCADNGMAFEDEGSFSSCRSEMEQYKQDVSDYVRCLADEREQVLDESNEAIDRFNCHARQTC